MKKENIISQESHKFPQGLAFIGALGLNYNLNLYL